MPLMRDFFITLSQNKPIERFLTGTRLGKRISRRFVAGETLEDVRSMFKSLLEEGFMLSVAYLGEHINEISLARKHTNEYLKLIDVISGYGKNTEISVKPTQLGLEFSKEEALKNLRRIVSKANDKGLYVNVDMEEYKYLWDTVDMVLKLNSDGLRVGTVIQAYLKEANKVLDNLSSYNINIRLVKGAYREPPDVAFQKKSDINESYKNLSLSMLERTGKIYPEFATHDHKIINFIVNEISRRKINRDFYEFQMLYGVRKRLQREIIKKHNLRLYLPYGDFWYPYFMRRLAEKPSNALLVLFGSLG